MKNPNRIPVVRSSHGMVVAGHPLAAAEGAAVLRAGGNAFDAALAAAAVLAVVTPQECGLGSDLMAVAHDARQGRTMALNATGFAPAAIRPEDFPDKAPMTGALSVSVPGMVGGWASLAERLGTRPLGELLRTATRLARDGFPVYEGLSRLIRERYALVESDPNCRALFAPQGQPLKAGALLRQPALARTLEALAGKGAGEFYGGDTARAIVAYVRERGGALNLDDMQAFQPLWQEVVEAPVFGARVCTMPPNSWAAALPLQLLAMRDDGSATAAEEVDFMVGGIAGRQWAYQQLTGNVADPALMDDAVVRQRLLAAAAGLNLPPAGAAALLRGTNTNNVVAVDAQGNSISLLQSVFVPFGSALLDPVSGALLNNRMGGFGVDPADPNCIAPRKRPAQTLTPALVVDDEGMLLACCTPGGPGQTACMAQFIARVLARGEDLAAAIAAPRWSITLTGQLILEDNASEALLQALAGRVPAVQSAAWGSVNFGSMVAIMRDGPGWVGCADTRKDAAVAAL